MVKCFQENGGEISWNNMIFFRQSKYFDSKLHLLMLCDLTPRNIFVDIKSRLTFASSNSEQCEQNQRNCRVAFVSSARNNKCNFLCRTCGIVDDTTIEEFANIKENEMNFNFCD